MNEICILILSGLPGSGKTLFASKWISWLEQVNNPASSEPRAEKFVSVNKLSCCHISYDDLMPSDVEKYLIDARQDQAASKWKEYRKHILHCVEDTIQSLTNKPCNVGTNDSSQVPQEILQRFQQSVRVPNLDEDINKIVFLIDDNMYYRSMRYDYYQLCRRYSISFAQLYLACSVEKAKVRNVQRQDPVTNSVIEDMATKFEPPNRENKWEMYSFTQNIDNTEEPKFQELLDVVLRSLADPVINLNKEEAVTISESRVVCSENIRHQADQIMRKLTSEKMMALKADMQKGSKHEMKVKAKTYNSTKTILLEQMKCGALKVPSDLEQYHRDASRDAHNPVFMFVKTVYDEYILKNS